MSEAQYLTKLFSLRNRLGCYQYVVLKKKKRLVNIGFAVHVFLVCTSCHLKTHHRSTRQSLPLFLSAIILLPKFQALSLVLQFGVYHIGN